MPKRTVPSRANDPRERWFCDPYATPLHGNFSFWEINDESHPSEKTAYGKAFGQAVNFISDSDSPSVDYDCKVQLMPEDFSIAVDGSYCLPVELLAVIDGWDLIVQRTYDLSELHRHLESEWLLKWRPRSSRVGGVYRQAVKYVLPSAKSRIMVENLEITMLAVGKYIGLGRSPQVLDIDLIEPPNQNASGGYNHFGDLWLISDKGTDWPVFKRLAREFEEEISSSDLDIKRVWDVQYLMDVVVKYDLCYMLASRLDGGPNKARVIYVASAIMYILETRYFGYTDSNGKKYSASKDMANSVFFASKAAKITSWLRVFEGSNLRSTDISRGDTNWPAVFITATLLALCRLYNVPDQVAVIIIAYNVVGSVLYVQSHRLQRSRRRQRSMVKAHIIGVLRSGTGVFTKLWFLQSQYMAFYHRVKLGYGWDQLPCLCLKIGFGDDGAEGDVYWSVEDQYSFYYENFNVIMRRETQMDSTFGIVMLRKAFLHGTRLIYPSLHSALNNIMLPEYPIRSKQDWARLAIRRRSQLYAMDIMEEHQHQNLYTDAMEYIFAKVVPFKSCRYDMEESELARKVSDGDMQQLHFARAFYDRCIPNIVA